MNDGPGHPPSKTHTDHRHNCTGSSHTLATLWQSATAPHAGHWGVLLNTLSHAMACSTACHAPHLSYAQWMGSTGLYSDGTQRKMTPICVHRRSCAALRKLRCCCTLPMPATPQQLGQRPHAIPQQYQHYQLPPPCFMRNVHDAQQPQGVPLLGFGRQLPPPLTVGRRPHGGIKWAVG